MPSIAPLTASGTRELKRPRPIPKAVREMVHLMVYGRADDPDGKPVDFIEAGKAVGIKPDIARRYLDRHDVIKLLRGERRAFREAVCAGNEGALRRVRDSSENGMAVISAVKVLEQIGDEEEQRGRGGAQQVPGFVICITTQKGAGGPTTIDAKPVRIPAQEPADDRDPAFQPPL